MLYLIIIYIIVFLFGSLSEYYLSIRYKNIKCYVNITSINTTNFSDILNENDHFIVQYIDLSFNLWLLIISLLGVIAILYMLYVYHCKRNGNDENNKIYTIIKYAIIFNSVAKLIFVSYGVAVFNGKECCNDKINFNDYPYLLYFILGFNIIDAFVSFSLLSIKDKSSHKNNENNDNDVLLL